MAQRVVDSNSGAEQRRGFGRRQIIRHQSHRFCRDHHVFGVTSIKADASDLSELAKNEITTAARVALKAVPAVPSHAYPLTGLPQGNVCANRIDASGNLVARHSRILNSRPETFFDELVAVAQAAGFHLDAYLPASRLRRRTLNDFEITSGLADLNGFHLNPFLWHE
jgi:hypothetical protein